jgi:hypothetical protein
LIHSILGELRTLRKDDGLDPMQARSDLVSILSADPEITRAIVTIIENELRDLKDNKVVSNISNALKESASRSNVDDARRDGVLYYLTETTPDVRQTILVQTIEELLKMSQSKDATLEALYQISSKENVDTVMQWTERQILTLNQAVFVLLYPDSSTTLL